MTTSTNQLRNPRLDKIFEMIKMGLFIFGSILFIAIYLPISITNCNKILNNTPEYVYNASCFCKNNPGSSPAVGQFILTDNDWFRQFNYTNDFSNVFSNIAPIIFSIHNDNQLYISFNSFSTYYQYYYPIQWSNTVIHNMTLTMFETYDPNGYFNGTILPQNSCFFINTDLLNTSNYEIIKKNNVNDCFTVVKQFLGENFNPVINTGYSNNPTYRKACDLDYCQIPYCPQSNLITIIFFCITVVGTYYTGLRTCKHLFVWIWYRKYKVPNAVTVPLFTSATISNLQEQKPNGEV